MMMDENVMFEQNVGLVKHIIKVKYKSTGQDYDDLYQEGCLGLLHAIRNFKPEYGYKFSTYAGICISGKINHYLRDIHYDAMKTPRELRLLYFKLSKECSDLSNEEELKYAANKLSMDYEQAKKAALLVNVYQPKSFEYEYSEGNSKTPLSSYISDGIDNFEQTETNDTLQKAMLYLDEKQKKAVILYYQEELSQSQIGERLGVKQVQVSRILAKAKELMQMGIEGKEPIKDKRVKTIIEYNGEKRSLAEWSKFTGIKYSTLKRRLDHGWDVEKTFMTLC